MLFAFTVSKSFVLEWGSHSLPLQFQLPGLEVLKVLRLFVV